MDREVLVRFCEGEFCLSGCLHLQDCPELSNRLYAWLDEMISDHEVITAGAGKIAQNLKAKLDSALDPKAEKKKVRM